MRCSRVSLPVGFSDWAVAAGRSLPFSEDVPLEGMLKDKLGVREVEMFSQGRYAIYQAIKRLKSDAPHVLVPGFGCPIVPIAVRAAGKIPVLVDIEAGKVTISPSDLREKLTQFDTAAVIITHELGQASNVEAFEIVRTMSGVAILEDIAVAFGGRFDDGSKLGSKGDAVIVSGGVGKPWSSWSFGALGFSHPAERGNFFKPGMALKSANQNLVGSLLSSAKLFSLLMLTQPVFGLLLHYLVSNAKGDGDTEFDSSQAKLSATKFDYALLYRQLIDLENILRQRLEMAGDVARILQERGYPLAFDPGGEGVHARLPFYTQSIATRAKVIASLARAGIDATIPCRSNLRELPGVLVGECGLPETQKTLDSILCVTLPMGAKLFTHLKQGLLQNLPRFDAHPHD